MALTVVYWLRSALAGVRRGGKLSSRRPETAGENGPTGWPGSCSRSAADLRRVHAAVVDEQNVVTVAERGELFLALALRQRRSGRQGGRARSARREIDRAAVRRVRRQPDEVDADTAAVRLFAGILGRLHHAAFGVGLGQVLRAGLERVRGTPPACGAWHAPAPAASANARTRCSFAIAVSPHHPHARGRGSAAAAQRTRGQRPT